MPLQSPENLRLFGKSISERDASRGHGRMRLDFDLVAAADEYEISVNGGIIYSGFSPGDFVDVPQPLAKVTLEVRAVAMPQPPSDWSDPLETVARPTPPVAPQRRPYDLQGWGIVLFWDLSNPGPDFARVLLLRNMDGQAPEPLAKDVLLIDEFVDTTYERDRTKYYRLVTRIPRAHVPGDVLGGDNLSFPGAYLSAEGPFSTTIADTMKFAGVDEHTRNVLLAEILGV